MRTRIITVVAIVVLLAGLGAHLSCSAKAQQDQRAQDDFMQRPVNKPEIYSNFSIPYAKWLSGEWGGPGTGPKWQKSLDAQFDLGVRGTRLSAQMNEIERQPGVYDWTEIDEAIRICRLRKKKVTLCAGLKSPQWPEVHLPNFYKDRAKLRAAGIAADEVNTTESGVGKEILAFMEALIKRYRNEPTVEGFQIENEPLEPFGDPKLAIPHNFLEREVRLASSLTSKPLMVTFGAGLTGDLTAMRGRRQEILNKLLKLPTKRVGIDIYQKGFAQTPFGIFGFDASGEHWTIAADFVKQIKAAGKTPMVAELQFEPWEADRSKVNYTDPTANKSFKPANCRYVFERARRLGSERIYLWGLEFQVAAHPDWLKETKTLIRETQK